LEHDQRRSSEARATAEVVPSDPRGTFTSSRNGVTFREEEYRNGVRHGRLRWWDVVEEFLPETDVSDVAGSTASEAVRSSGREEGRARANVLVAIIAERESRAAYFLQEQEMMSTMPSTASIPAS
jgi:hypothetical protein